jgi:hypothetical protein
MAEELYHKLEDRGFDSQLGHWIFSIYLILPAALGPGVYSASYRNEHQKQKEMFLGSRVRLAHEADNLTTICELII